MWQSVYLGLLRDQSLGVVDDEAPGVEDLVAKQVRMRRLIAALGSYIQGPDHNAQALLAQQDRRARETAQAEADAAERQGPNRVEAQALTDRPPAHGTTENTEQVNLVTPRLPLEDAEGNMMRIMVRKESTNQRTGPSEFRSMQLTGKAT